MDLDANFLTVKKSESKRARVPMLLFRLVTMGPHTFVSLGSKKVKPIDRKS